MPTNLTPKNMDILAKRPRCQLCNMWNCPRSRNSQMDQRVKDDNCQKHQRRWKEEHVAWSSSFTWGTVKITEQRRAEKNADVDGRVRLKHSSVIRWGWVIWGVPEQPQLLGPFLASQYFGCRTHNHHQRTQLATIYLQRIGIGFSGNIYYRKIFKNIYFFLQKF